MEVLRVIANAKTKVQNEWLK